MGRRKDKELYWAEVTAVPCAHIAAYYDWLWTQDHQLGTNLLRKGYEQWARGYIEFGFNNLYGPQLAIKNKIAV